MTMPITEIPIYETENKAKGVLDALYRLDESDSFPIDLAVATTLTKSIIEDLKRIDLEVSAAEKAMR